MQHYQHYHRMNILLKCWRLDYRSGYDEELVWALVQRHGGHISIRVDHILFWLHPDWEVVLVLAFPDLRRVPGEDYL